MHLTLLVWAMLAQGPANPYLARAMAQIRDLDERAALKTLAEARKWPGNTPQDLAQVALYSGLAHAGLSEERLAVDAFREALLLQPDLTLPSDVSPLVRRWWVKAGGRSPRGESEPPVPAPSTAPPSTATVVPPGPAAPAPAPAFVAATEPPPPPAPPRWGRWVGTGIAVVGLAGVAVAGVLASQLQGMEQRAEQAPGMSTAGPLHTQAIHQAQAANALYAVGGGVALAGTAVFVWKF